MIFPILILGFLLRLPSLNQSFWLDEATSLLTTRMSLTDFFTKFMPGDFHPPLYYLTLRVWVNIFGTTEVAARSLSIVFALLTIFLIYKISKSCIAALFLATAPLFLYYSQEARMYSMSTFLVALSVYLFLKKDWLKFSIVLALIGLTDYLPLLIIPVFFLYTYISKSSFKKLLLAQIPLIVAFVIWLPTFIKQFLGGISVTNNLPQWAAVLGKFSLKDTLLIPVKLALGRISFDNKFLYGLVVLGVLGLIAYLTYLSFKIFKKFSLIDLWLFVPLLLALVISLKLPILNYFRFLFVLPAFYILIALGISTFKNQKTRFIFVSLIILINLITSFTYLLSARFQREDWRGTANFIGQNNVVFPNVSQREAFLYYNPKANITEPENLNSENKDLYLMRYVQDISDPQDLTRQKIESLGYSKTKEYNFNGVVFWQYQLD